MQTSGAMRREKAKVRLRRMGIAKAIPIATPTGIDGYRFRSTHPTGLPLSGRLEARRPARHPPPAHGTRTPIPVTARPAWISGSRIPLW